MYILCELVIYVVILWNLLFIINLNKLMINIYLILKIIRMKFFIEKQILKYINIELYFIKNLKFLKKELLILKLILEEKKEKILKDLLDSYSINIKIFYIILNKKYIDKNQYNNSLISKNNLEMYRII